MIAAADGESATETEPEILVIGADDTAVSTAQEGTESAATEWKLFHITTAQQVEDLTNAASTDIAITGADAVDAAAFEMDTLSVGDFVETTGKVSGATEITTGDQLKTNLEAGNDVVLLSDIVLPADLSYFWLDKSVTLYLNGHRITTTDDYNNNALFAVKGTATFTIDAGDGGYSAAEQYAGSTPVISGFGTGNVIEAAEGTTVTVKGVTFQNNKGTVVKASGSASAAAAVTIKNCTFTGNGSSSSHGGGIYASYSNVSVSGSTFTGNTAYRGGAIYAENVTNLTLTGNTIQSNSANDGGGLFLARIDADNTVTVTGNTITGNTATGGSGGGLYLDYVGNFTLSGNAANKIDGNTANTYGGGIFAWDSSINISGGTIDGNEAGEQGGGIYISGASTLTMSGGSISDNTCKIDSGWNLGGGGVRSDGSTVFKLSGGKINGNYSLLGGGEILMTGSTEFTMTGGSVSNNAAWYGEGGGISISCTATITGGFICNNASGYALSGTANASYPHWGGGGIFVSDQGGVLTLVGASITSNSAGGFGGGVAGCATGAVFMFEDGAYIASNTADGMNTSGGASAKSEDREYAANNTAFMEGGYDDYFCALNSYVSTTMLGVDEGWTGTADYEAVDYYNGGAYGKSGSGTYVMANTMMGLTANPSGSPTGVSVTISGNKSYTHGGGVLCNGTIYVGTPDGKDLELGDRLKLTLYKELNIPLAYEFTFTITEETTDSQNNPVYTVLHTDTNKTSSTEKTGEIAFEPLTFNEAGTYTYYIKESAKIPSELDADEVTMSDAEYKIVVTVADQDLSSGYVVTMTWHKATAVNIYQKNDVGEWEPLTDTTSVPVAVSLSSDEHHYGSITIGSADTAAFTNEITTPQKTETNQGDGTKDKDGNITYNNVELGETITYNISYYNNNDENATVVIKDQLDPGVDYVENSAQIRGAYDSSTGEYAWENADTKAVYDDTTHTLTFTINAEEYEYGKVRFSVKVNVNAFDEESPSVDNTASVQVGNKSEVTTNTVTNEMDTVEVSVNKEWKDADNEYDTRDAYAVTLTGTILVEEDDGNGGITIITKTVYSNTKAFTINDSSYTWKNLPKYYDGGIEIAYSVTESTVPSGYQPSVSGSAKEGYKITNTLTGTVDVSGSKTWNDSNDQDGKRPSSITIRLYADGSEAASKKVTAADDWSWTFEELAKYSSEGKEITYTISEDLVANYTGRVDGYNVTNTHTPETTNVTVNKVWDDAGDKDGKRASYEVTLTGTMAIIVGGEVQTKTVYTDTQVLEADELTYTWSGLAKYSEGKEITYTVTESVVPTGYTAEITGNATEGFTITNSHTPETEPETTPETTPQSEPETTSQSESETELQTEPQTDAENTISVTKNLTYNEDVLYAENATFYVALYSDEARTVRVSEVKAITFTNASSGTAAFTGLETGKTYYVGECDADGNAIASGNVNGTLFYANFADGYTVTIANTGDNVSVSFENEFLDVPHGFYIEEEEPTTTNEESETTVTESEEATERESETETKAVQTGDGTPLAGMMGLMLLALAVLLVTGMTAGLKRRKQ